MKHLVSDNSLSIVFTLLMPLTGLLGPGCFHADEYLECIDDADCMSGVCSYGVCEDFPDTSPVDTDTTDTEGPVLTVDEGELYWAKMANGDCNDVAYLPDNSIVITGQIGSKATFGKGEVNETQLTARGLHDAFIAKYHLDGTLAWVRQMGGVENQEFGGAISVMSDGAILITGGFRDWAFFGEGEANETILNAEGMGDNFIARYNPDGTLAWAKSLGTALNDQELAIAALADGAFVVVGATMNDITFGQGEPGETVLGPQGVSCSFIAKYNSDGTLNWVRSLAEPSSGPSYLQTRPDGTVVVAGSFGSSAVFAAGEPNETTLTAIEAVNMYLAKVDADGSLLWATSGGTGSDDAEVRGLSLLPDGSSLVTGAYDNAATFGAGEANEQTLYPSSDSEIFIAKYNPDGTLGWVKSAGGSRYDDVAGISALPDGSSVVVGHFQRDAVFGKNEPNETALVGGNDSTLFIALYNADGSLAWVRADGGPSWLSPSGLSLKPDGTALVITGVFSGSTTLGIGDANQTTIDGGGITYIFLAEYAL